MAIRIIYPDGQHVQVLPLAKREEMRITCWCNLQTLQHNLVYGKSLPGQRKTTETGPLFRLEFSPSTFQHLAPMGGAGLHDFAERTKSGKSQSLSFQPLTLDAAMQQCIAALMHYPGNAETKPMYHYAHVLELLWLQQENYIRAQQPRPLHVRNEYDKERIVFARDYLLTHLDAPPTLSQLAAIAGINEFKLKHGFKELFNQPVFAYLAEVRLDMARRALREKQKTVTQIAFELGYASLQHFSKAFKDKFGVSPGKYEAF